MATRKKRAPASRKSKRPLLTSLSTDWYWEQDAALRFTRVEVQTGTPGEQELARRILGKRRWETGISVEGGWEAHRRLLKLRAPFRDLLMWRDFEDGSRRYISVSGEPRFDAKGRFTGYRGVGRDITELKRAEQLLRLEHSVTRYLAEASTAMESAQGALRVICESERWDCAEFWKLEEADGVMRRFVHWAMPGIEAAQRYTDASHDVEFEPGLGLVGSVWQSGEPLWIPDTQQDPRARRKTLSKETGLRAALLAPVRSGDRVVAVLGFKSRVIRAPDERLLQALGVICAQIGLFLRRAAAEARVRESEERFRRTFELAGVGVAHVGLDRRFLRVNPRICEMFGYREEELIGLSLRDLSHPEDRDVIDSQREKLYAGEIEAVRLEKRYLRKDGSVVWVAISVAFERDAAGKPLYAISVLDDISARKAAEDALRESEERFRHTFELAGVGVAHIGMDRGFIRVNRRFCEILGYSEAELIGVSGRDISHPEDKDVMHAHRPRLYAGEIDAVRGEKRYLRKDGAVVWVAYTLAVERDSAGKPQYEIAVYDDISARKATEVALRESEERFRRTFELAGSGLAHIGMDRRFIRVNRKLCEILGYPEEELLRLRGKDISHPDDADVINEQRPRLYAGEIDIVSLEKRYVRKDRSVVWVTFAMVVERDAEGRPRYEIAIYDDITARKAAEDALRESEERFRSLTEMSSDFFWQTDAQHRFSEMVHGPTYAGKMGRVVGKSPWELPASHPDEAGWAAMRATMDAHEPFRDFEFGRPWNQGTVRYFSVSGEPHFTAEGNFAGYRGVGRDITEIVLARERIASLAYHDALTGLDNRISLAPALDKAIGRTRRRGTKLAGVFLDLDGFKQINDLYGHDAGDRLLIEAAQRLRSSLRASDVVARLGGDEFFVALEDLSDSAPAERVAKKLLAVLLQPYDIGGGKEASVSASIGISIFPDDAGDASTLIKHADTAMYAAKQAGKNSYRLFTAVPAANDARPAGQDSKTRA